jgi:HD-GYP domain-containing protein (c-di-GMP phosphodiesterase class II)
MTLSARWWAFWGLVLAAPMLFFATMLASPGSDSLWVQPTFHFWVVSGTAIAAFVASAVLVGLTQSVRESRLLFLGLAFMSIAAVFAVHGLDTPGHIHDALNPELAVSSWLSIFLAALFISASVIDLPESAEHWLKENGTLIFGAVTLALGLYIGLSQAFPGWLGWLPIDNRNLQLASTAATLGLLGFCAWRYFQAFMFARLISQWAMVCLMLMLFEVQVSMTWGRMWQLSWWLYHGTYAGAFVVLFASWAVEWRRAGSVRVISEALSMRDAVAQLNHGYERPIADLVDAIEWKDVYTLGHVRRVATYAVMIGRELGLSTHDLRSLALGAQMHDVGKIGVPDRILTKPSKLTAEEFEVIKEHVGRGYEIAVGVKALHEAIDAIRYHHERLDGTGYPTGLKGEDIPLNARIVAVADAFDAMTSGRVYQPAVTKEDAFAELRTCAGTHFDPDVVDAFGTAITRMRDLEVATPGTVAPAGGKVAAA